MTKSKKKKIARTSPQIWHEQLAHAFSPSVKEQGLLLAALGNVAIQSLGEEHIDAEVRDDDTTYTVSFLNIEHSITAKCPCESWSTFHEPCAHMWATLLTAKDSKKTVEPFPPVANWAALMLPEAQTKPQAATSSGYVLEYTLAVDNRIELDITKRRILKSGALGQSSSVKFDIFHDTTHFAEDQALLASIYGMYLRHNSYQSSWYSSYRSNKFLSFPLDQAALQALLPALAASGRCYLETEQQRHDSPLRSGSRGGIAWALADQDSPRKKNLTYLAKIVIDGREVDVDACRPFFNTTPIYFICDNCLHTLPNVSFDWVTILLRRKGKLTVPKTELRELLATSMTQPAAPAIESPESMRPDERNDIVPKPCIELTMDQSGLWSQAWVDYEGFEIPLNDPRPTILDPERWVRIQRNQEEEERIAQTLLTQGIDPHASRTMDPQALWNVVDALGSLGWTVRSRDKRRFQSGKCGQLRISSGLDWFDLEGDITFGDIVVPLPKAVRAFLRGETTIELDNGSLGLLPREWMDQYAQLLELGDPGRAKDTKLRFHSSHALLLDSLLEECPEQPRDFLALRQRMKAFDGVVPPEPPVSFQGQLRGYQREALGWFDFLATFGFGGILADDMGLGKTIQALAWMALCKERGTQSPSLVVAPTSLMFNWRDEAQRFAPSLRVATFTGQNRANMTEQFGEYDLILTTYGLIRRDIEALRHVQWSSVILDESQAIKNPDSQTAKAIRLLSAGHRLCLSGTPLENRLDELWSQMHFLNPGLLGTRTQFETRFAKPIAQGNTEAKELLQRTSKPFLLRRTKEAVASDLPEKQESVIHCEMTEAQAKIYKRLHAHYRAEILSTIENQGLERSQIKVLEGLLRLRQVACHPALVGEENAGSGKLEELSHLVRDIVDEGHKVLIFSQFTKFLTIISDMLTKQKIAHEYLDGSTPAKSREKKVAAFQSPDGPPVFCISLKAGGVGLNLTAADYVFIMDPWWNPAVESQAVNRAHRIGQDKNVFAYRLISEGSIDEKVLTLQQEKRDLADMLLEGATASVGALTREDLERLLE